MEWYFQELVVGLLYVVFAALIFDIVRRWFFDGVNGATIGLL